ncbi:MAG: hypothetical protein NC915_06810 [Candidatus Omnitrophica bacterium]|nr:hypothetical protein [Candidatus Omnitrophota bacterium]
MELKKQEEIKNEEGKIKELIKIYDIQGIEILGRVRKIGQQQECSGDKLEVWGEIDLPCEFNSEEIKTELRFGNRLKILNHELDKEWGYLEIIDNKNYRMLGFILTCLKYSEGFNKAIKKIEKELTKLDKKLQKRKQIKEKGDDI